MYFIPRNIKTRFEFIDGFGFYELFVFLIFAGIGGGISFFVYFLTKKFFSFLLFILISAAGFIGVRKDPRMGNSFFDLIIEFKSFSSKQQTYFYEFGTGRD